ncbi:hypothetical protein ABEB36_013823 [Hypothenemus hampei]|uniref:F-box domain-containing protein n=1 Tax=Hypothenemus hampei TaxID=57062 RepID=A0ABD1E9W3_HYPHA
MRFPTEIIEHILLKCDGKTLLTAKTTSDILSDVVEYLGKRTRIWEWCCKEEIPQEQLLEYLPSYEIYGKDKWKHIYNNWSAWELQSTDIVEPKLCPNNTLRRISSIAVSSDHIAVGNEDGRLKLYTSHWEPVFEHRVVAVKLTKLTFIGYQDYNNENDLNICLVTAFNNGISLISFNGFRKEQYDILDVKSHSIYGNYICIEKVGGRMTILEISSKTNFYDRREIKEIWFTRIYSPRCITSYHMWNEKCTFLINGVVSQVNYKKPNITPMDEMEKVMTVKFYAPLWLDRSTTQIFRNNVIINIYKYADKSSGSPDIIDDYVEIIILRPDGHYSKKLFNAWEIFRSVITCIYLYGNTLLIATACGTVYFYQLNNWKNFDMKNYVAKKIVGKHPIIAIAVKEVKGERIFYVCSTFAIHKIVCWVPGNCDQ